MTHKPGHPGGPLGEGHDDASYWWMDDGASGASRPSDARLKLERLRNDVHSAPDLSARILGQAQRHDAFVPRSKRRAIRAMRWGSGVAAAMLLGLTLFLIYRTPAGEVVRPSGPTPVSDIVTDVQAEAQTLRENVLEIPERVRSVNRLAVQNAKVRAPEATTIPTSVVARDTQPDFSPTLANTWSEGTSLVARYNVTDATRPTTPLGLSSLSDALDAIARTLESHEYRAQLRDGLVPQQRMGTLIEASSGPAKAGFFTSDDPARR